MKRMPIGPDAGSPESTKHAISTAKTQLVPAIIGVSEKIRFSKNPTHTSRTTTKRPAVAGCAFTRELIISEAVHTSSHQLPLNAVTFLHMNLACASSNVPYRVGIKLAMPVAVTPSALPAALNSAAVPTFAPSVRTVGRIVSEGLALAPDARGREAEQAKTPHELRGTSTILAIQVIDLTVLVFEPIWLLPSVVCGNSVQVLPFRPLR
jgi:hypothetical protein